jgi:hypothetical protein
MNNSLLKRFKSIYRQEKVSSFIIIVGVVDAILGGVDQRTSLLTVGLTTVGVAIAYRWLTVQKYSEEIPEKSAKYYLPPQPDNSPLPNLNSKRNSRL